MKISIHNGYKLITDKSFYQKIISTHLSKNKTLFPNETMEKAGKELEKFLKIGVGRNFIVSENVIKSLSFIKLKTPYNYNVFKDIEDGVKIYLLPNNEVLRIQKENNELFLGIFFNEGIQFKWNFWKADLNTGKSTMQNYREYEKEVILDNQFDSSIEYYEHKVFALLCFVFLSDIITKEIEPNSKEGTRKSGKILNNSPIKFTYINSDWNITYVRSEGFTVTGHFALRAYGIGRFQRRLVFIEPYQKHGYMIKNKKQSM